MGVAIAAVLCADSAGRIPRDICQGGAAPASIAERLRMVNDSSSPLCDEETMNRITLAVIVGSGLLVVQVAQAQRLDTLRFRRLAVSPVDIHALAPLAVPSPWAQYSLKRGYGEARKLVLDSGSIAPTHWLRGGIIGAALVGVVGAGTALGLSGCRCVDDALLGFVPGAMIGFPLGALIGGQFPKQRK